MTLHFAVGKNKKEYPIRVEKFDKALKHIRKNKLDEMDIEAIQTTFEIMRELLGESAKSQGLSYEKILNDEIAQEKGAAIPDGKRPSQEQETPQGGGEPLKEEDCGPVQEQSSSSAPSEEPKKKTADGRSRPKGGKAPGSGKMSKRDTQGEPAVIPLQNLSNGDICPCCRQGRCYQHKPGIIGIIKAQPTLSYAVYEQEKVRCNSCHTLYGASVPPEITKDRVGPAHFEAAASMLLMRYHLAIPNLRIERWLKWQEVSLADSTQWDVMREGARLLEPLFQQFVRFCAQAELQIIDDGSTRIISCHREIKTELALAKVAGISPKQVRTGITTTAVIGESASGSITTYFSGREHQGEIAYELDTERIDDTFVVRMSDAASKATSTHPFPEKDEHGVTKNHKGNVRKDQRVIIVHCLAHLRNMFSGLMDQAEELCSFILKNISDIYDIEDKATRQRLSPQQRLELHQQNSTPLIENIRKRVAQEIEAKNYMPHELVGKALRYVTNNLTACSGFLRYAGCPLDSNSVERRIIPVVQHRFSSKAYQTISGAAVGDIAMSLIVSAVTNGLNPLHYLTRCFEFHEDLKECPHLWYPWNYEQRWRSLKDARIAERESRNSVGYEILHRTLKNESYDKRRNLARTGKTPSPEAIRAQM